MRNPEKKPNHIKQSLAQVNNMTTQSNLNNFSEAPYKILIVDDDNEQRSLQKEILCQPDFETFEASDGEQAINILKEDEFDLVLIDKNMPGINGEETCRRIRNDLNLKLLPVIMITGVIDDNHVISSIQAGANDFILKPFNVVELTSRVKNFAANKRLTDNLDSTENLLFTIARLVEARDKNTHNHCERIIHLVSVFGKKLNLDKTQITALRRGGILHDIGKIAVPDSVLLKEEKLTEDDWDKIRQHPVIGEQLLSELKSMENVLPIVRSHHERWDGTGYPDGLKGEDIPYLARVFQFADMYDALAYQRSYKKAFPLEKIIKTFEEETEKGWRDPRLSRIFIDMLKNDRELFDIPITKNKAFV
jgi:cyclic di-GMP phosphodiesterase